MLFYGTHFFEKSVKNSIDFQNYFQKFKDFRLKIVSNWLILKNFDHITFKTPFRRVFENFENFEKFWKILHLNVFLRKNFSPNALFYGSKESILFCWDLLGAGLSQISLIYVLLFRDFRVVTRLGSNILGLRKKCIKCHVNHLQSPLWKPCSIFRSTAILGVPPPPSA